MTSAQPPSGAADMEPDEVLQPDATRSTSGPSPFGKSTDSLQTDSAQLGTPPPAPAPFGRRTPAVSSDAPVSSAPTETVSSPAAPAPSTALVQPGLSVTLENLRAFYGEAEPVKGIDVEFRANEVTAIIGPSGCGKSTLVRCVNRMHEEIPGARAEGRVLLDGLNVYDASVDVVAVRRAIGMVFQKPNPFPTMSVFDNVASGLRLSSQGRGVRSKVNLQAKVEAALRSAGLWEEVAERLSEPGAGLSGGQQQRLCLARSLAVDPEVILMDEPCSALDPIATLRIEQLIDQLKARVTIVIVTHNMQQAARVADRTAFMLDGELVEVGATQDIFTKPGDPRTEEYVTGKFG
jgi:phosphate transport system ATP-binding protein